MSVTPHRVAVAALLSLEFDAPRQALEAADPLLGSSVEDNRDGSGARRLATDTGHPAWNPLR